MYGLEQTQGNRILIHFYINLHLFFFLQCSPKFNKRRAFNKTVCPGKMSKNVRNRAYVYSGLKSTMNLLEAIILLSFQNDFLAQTRLI